MNHHFNIHQQQEVLDLNNKNHHHNNPANSTTLNNTNNNDNKEDPINVLNTIITSTINKRQQQEQEDQTHNVNNIKNNNNTKMSLLSFDNLNSLISGSVAGALSRTSTAGFERLTIIQQVQGTGLNSKYNGCFKALKNMIKNEGFLSLFKGNGANIVKVSPNSGIRFLTYDFCKNLFTGNDPTKKLGRIETLASGAMAGLTSTVFTYPIDLIRIRLSLQGSGIGHFSSSPSSSSSPFSTTSPNLSSVTATRYNGIRHGFQTIHAEEGVRGLYRGLGTAIMSVAPWVSLSFLSYEGFKSFVNSDIIDHHHHHNNNNVDDVNNNVNNNVNNSVNNNNNESNNNDNRSRDMTVDLLCGAASGAFTMTVCYPLDVLRRRMMVQGIGGNKVVYKNGFDALKSIYKNEGVSAFYKGIKPAYFKVVPTVAISFAAYELCKELLDSQYRNNNNNNC